MMMRVIPLISLLALVACGEVALDRSEQGKVGPAYPGSVILREVEGSTAETYDPPTGDSSCETRFTHYGVNDEPEKVTSFYEGQGVTRLGEGGRFDRGYRWVGEKAGHEASWRRVDIASGNISGNPDYTTTYSVSAPDCNGGGGSKKVQVSPEPSRP